MYAAVSVSSRPTYKCTRFYVGRYRRPYCPTDECTRFCVGQYQRLLNLYFSNKSNSSAGRRPPRPHSREGRDRETGEKLRCTQCERHSDVRREDRRFNLTPLYTLSVTSISDPPNAFIRNFDLEKHGGRFN